MDTICIFSSDKLFEQKMQRILTEKLTLHHDEINIHVIMRYIKQNSPTIIIIHHSIKCLQLTKVIDYLVTNKIVPVIYIHKTIGHSEFYQFINDLYFTNLQEGKTESTLPIVCSLTCKISNQFNHLEKKMKQLELKLKEKEIIDHAKMILMEDLHLTENEAHQWITKEAMNKRLSKEKIAFSVIENRRNMIDNH